jgi:DNA-binding NarL/FixJ family response regulator
MELTTTRGLSGGLQLLRESAFDIVLAAYEPGGLDTLESLSAIKTGSHAQQAVLVLGDSPSCELDACCVESGADAYVCLRSTTVRALWCQILRAVERQRLLLENQRLRQQLQLQRNSDRDEIERVLKAQRRLMGDRGLCASEALCPRYQPILEAYIMLNGPGLEQELASLAHDLQAAGYTSADFLGLHLQAVEKMVADLAGRGARHILQRSGVLALDVLLRLSGTSW